MTNADLESKFTGLAEGILPPDQARRLMDLCSRIEKLPSASAMAKAAAV
jgi:hypothetical protein